MSNFWDTPRGKLERAWNVFRLKDEWQELSFSEQFECLLMIINECVPLMAGLFSSMKTKDRHPKKRE